MLCCPPAPGQENGSTLAYAGNAALVHDPRTRQREKTIEFEEINMTENASGAALASGIHAFCKHAWWAFLIGGIASLVFGVLAFSQPGIALLVLSIFFAAAILVDGVVNTIGALKHRNQDGWWFLLAFGILGTLAGVYLLVVPPASMLVFVWLVAFIALLNGFTLISLGWRIRKEIRSEWVLYLSGALSALFGLLILFRIDIGGLAVIYLIATWAVLVGVLRIVFALRVRKLVSSRAEAVA
jgi:uncharacterized membrane protein HdeD (DUF308 family)